MNSHVHPLFAGILNNFAATFTAATNRNQAVTMPDTKSDIGFATPTPRGSLPNSLGTFHIVHEFRNGRVTKQRMPDIYEARAELAAIVKNFRSWGHYVRRDRDHSFCIAPLDGGWAKTVFISFE